MEGYTASFTPRSRRTINSGFVYFFYVVGDRIRERLYIERFVMVRGNKKSERIVYCKLLPVSKYNIRKKQKLKYLTLRVTSKSLKHYSLSSSMLKKLRYW